MKSCKQRPSNIRLFGYLFRKEIGLDSRRLTALSIVDAIRQRTLTLANLEHFSATCRASALGEIDEAAYHLSIPQSDAPSTHLEQGKLLSS